ncbi:hypothetical protein QE177_09065 [Arsenophonus sp. aPb]|uniref:hypothetical protein n=2 Tax=unclassified Arsenophonus TaxID=2627083 RepID=UPI0024684C6B|nr:hypothetical protein [Arsenophonus sp. aPb]WGL97371.1 hypothetical protein QE177_09065 [Arsenophonus sp. aPb]
MFIIINKYPFMVDLFLFAIYSYCTTEYEQGKIMKIISRKEAVEFGQTRFYTGKPCKKGHIAERFTSNGVCVTCAAKHASDYRKEINRLLQQARKMVRAAQEVS